MLLKGGHSPQSSLSAAPGRPRRQPGRMQEASSTRLYLKMQEFLGRGVSSDWSYLEVRSTRAAFLHQSVMQGHALEGAFE